MPAHLEIIDEIAVLNLGDDENRFSPDWLTTTKTAFGPSTARRKCNSSAASTWSADIPTALRAETAG